jgi:hypothetical protein
MGIMKKILRALMLLAIIVTSLSLAKTVNASYQVSVGQTFTYDIIDAKIQMDYEGSLSSGNGYILNGYYRPNGTQCVVNVTGVDPPTHVNWTVTSGPYIENGQSSALDVIAMQFLMIFVLPLYEEVGELSQYDAEFYISAGTGLILIPFWDTYYFTDFIYFAGDTHISALSANGRYDDTIILGDFKQSSGMSIFEWFMAGEIVVEDPSTSLDFQFFHQLKIVYETNSGVLQSIKMTSYVDGLSSGKEIKLWVNYLAEIGGYDSPDYSFTDTEFAPGFEWFIAVGAICLISIPIIVYKKRKK